MSEEKQNKRTVANVVYSVLVFFAVFFIGAGISDPDGFINHKLGGGSLVSFGLALVAAIAFSMWFAKRNSRN